MALAHKVMQVRTPNMLGPQDGQPCGRLSGLVSACRYVSVCVCVSVCVMEWGWMARCVLHVSTLLACRSSCLHHVLNNGYVSWHIECPAVSDITRVLATVRHMLANVFGIVNVITPESLCPPLPCARCLEVTRLIESPGRVKASDSISSKCAETLKPNSHQIERSKWAGSGWGWFCPAICLIAV